MDQLAGDPQGLHPVGDQDAGLDGGSGADDRGPPTVRETALGSQLGTDLAEHLGLELGEEGQRPRHAAGGVVLGEPVGRHHVGEHLGAGLAVGGVVRVALAVEHLAHGVGLLAVKRVLERRLMGLVVGRHGTVREPARHVEPPLSVGLHDEGLVASQGHLRPRALGWLVVGAHGFLEVGDVEARPLLLVVVPPHVLLAFGPRLAVGIGRRPVVDDVAVHRPRPRPLGCDPRVLLPVGLAPGGQVLLVGVAAAVDPDSAGRRAVGLEVLVAGHGLAVGDGEAVDLLEDGLSRGLRMVAVGRVVPRQLEDGLVLGIDGAGELLPDAATEVVREPQVGTGVARRIEGLVMPLQHALGVGEGAVLLGVGGGRKQEDLGADVAGSELAGLDLRRVVPEAR